MISEDLAAFVSNLRFEQIPENVVARVKDLVLDNIGCAFGGIAIPPTLKIYDTEQGARVLYDILRLHFSPGKATVWGRNLKTSCLLAAFINAATSNSPEYDDTILLLHPGTVVIPSAMAVGEVEDVNGRNIVEAIVSGYEVSIRIMQCLGVSHRERGWRATGTVGTFGAAAAASKILNLDIEKTATALGLAGCQAAGLWARGTMTRVLDAGRAAYGGVLSALLAQEGFSGPHGIFDAQDNFCKATSDGYDLSKMTEGLHVNYEILRVGMKPYSTARALHAPIDGVIELMEKHSIRPREIDRMIVRTDGITARDCARYEPGNVRSAMQSLPYSIALAVVINIKLGYYGLYKAKKIAALTEAAGITCKLGTHYEAGALMIAGLHFAASIENLEARPSEFPMGRWKNPLIRGLEQVDKYGTTFRVPKGPGLGVEVVEADLTLSSG